MAVRFGGRLLQGSDVRAVETALRDKGLEREFSRAIQRGDSPNSMNRIFKAAGYRFNRFQTVNYLSQTSMPGVLLTYTDKIAARYGRRSVINAAAFEKAGYAGDIHIRIGGEDIYGNYQDVVIKIKHSPYESLSGLTQDILRDIDYYTKKYKFKQDSTFLLDVYVT